MPKSRRITLFKWGYEGWGNATKTLVRTIDASERVLGHEPPIFVDIRFSRSVRAIGFRDRAFEQQLGHARYRWMRSLGNESTGSTRKMRIQCPDAAHQLLDLALDAAEANRRVIFFCSCGSPHAADWCHRTQVAKLVVRAARSRAARIEVGPMQYRAGRWQLPIFLFDVEAGDRARDLVLYGFRLRAQRSLNALRP